MTESTHRDVEGPPSQPPSLQSSASSTLGVPGSNSLPLPSATSATRNVETQKAPLDTTSDKATAAFIRRTLCSHNVLLGNGEKGRSTPRPIGDMLPPLTSSNEVDLQLYGIISVIIKEFVQTWYTKITPDQVFVNEVIQIIAHCTRGLEQRLRKVDLEALLLDEIPELLQAHLSSFRLAMHQAASSTSLASDPRTIYHALHPHPALSPVPTDLVPSTVFEQRESESAWRQLLVHGVLALLLPTEDLENGCLRTLVAEIFAEMILGNGISGKACEGWVLWEGITRIGEVLQTDAPKEVDSQSEDASTEQSLTRLERYGLLPHEGSDVRSKEQLDIGQPCHQTTTGYTSGLFWTVVQYAFLAFTAARAVIFSLATSSSLPSRSAISEQSSVEMSGQSKMPHADTTASRRPLGAKRPVVNMALWSCAAQFAELDVRMPWLLGFISMLHHGALVGPGSVGDTDGVLDRFLSHTIHTRILNPAFLPVALRTLRATLFPSNTLGPPREMPTDEEAKVIKHRCAATLLDLVPSKVAAGFFASSEHEDQVRQIEDILSCLDDTYLNKHFVFQVVELIVLRLFPELGDQGVKDLLEERIS
ncbi:PXA domain containing protein [Pyrenophora tritici-repentis]|nr:PXA domain containing protein [Pyrenophora tritici-repentis]